MNKKAFRVLLDMAMATDPWPGDSESSHEAFRAYLNGLADRFGYASWLVAYHEFQPERPTPIDDITPYDRLSGREKQVFNRMAVGTPPANIAIDLGLSVKTVSTYRARILEKMQMRSNAEIAAYAVRYQIPLTDEGVEI